MLPIELKHESRAYQPGEEWDFYINSIGKYSAIDHEFLSQICYEHYDRFNLYFPRFDITKNNIVRIKLTTLEIYNSIRYDKNQDIDFWYNHIDSDYARKSLENYSILSSIIKNGTWKLPPVIIRNELAQNLGDMNYGNPIHLIEGTHRVSYLRRWFEKGNVDKNKEHEFLLIK